MYLAFKGGTGDYVALFEPTASRLEKDGSGHILASIGEETGLIPYTCYFSTKSYMHNNQMTIDAFTSAIYRGQQWFFENSTEDVADSIIEFFPGTDKETIMTVIDNYKKIDALAHNPKIHEENLNTLMDIIEEYDENLITERPEFDKIVNNTFAEKAILNN